MDLLTEYLAIKQRQEGCFAASALPHAPVVAHHDVERRPSASRAALGAVLQRAWRAVAPA